MTVEMMLLNMVKEMCSASDFPNYGLGGGSYGCSPVSQGISSGYSDIYGEYLDGMWLDIPLEHVMEIMLLFYSVEKEKY